MNTLEKQFIPCICLYEQNAVKSTKDHTVIADNPCRLAAEYAAAQADAIYVLDLSYDDASHDAAMDTLKALCASVVIPVIGSGHIRRMEDVKKLLYAGCSAVILDYRDPAQLELTQEVSLKFGKDKIIAGIDSLGQLVDNKETIEAYTSCVYMYQTKHYEEAALQSPVPVIPAFPDAGLDVVIHALGYGNIAGISGDLVTLNVKSLDAIKSFCEEKQINVNRHQGKISWEELKKGPDGLVPVVVQDHATNAVLMVAYMNQQAYEQTLRSGVMTYYSRSRKELWLKGEASGHYQYVHELSADCDLDTILAKVTQIGAACHTGSYSCFFNEIQTRTSKEEKHNPFEVFTEVYDVIQDRKVHPKEGSYTNYLFDKGIDKILKKVGEEATEIVIAAKNPNANEIKYEIADFLYHMMVLMAEKNVTWEEITEELAKR